MGNPAALVLGASGQIGRFLVPRLRDAGWMVLAASRQPRMTQHPDVTWLQGDLFSGLPVLPADLSHDQVVHRVMVDVQRRIDSMLEFRLREALAPILARHTDAMIREMRDELSDTMRDVVTRSVTQELAKLRQR